MEIHIITCTKWYWLITSCTDNAIANILFLGGRGMRVHHFLLGSLVAFLMFASGCDDNGSSNPFAGAIETRGPSVDITYPLAIGNTWYYRTLYHEFPSQDAVTALDPVEDLRSLTKLEIIENPLDDFPEGTYCFRESIWWEEQGGYYPMHYSWRLQTEEGLFELAYIYNYDIPTTTLADAIPFPFPMTAELYSQPWKWQNHELDDDIIRYDSPWAQHFGYPYEIGNSWILRNDIRRQVTGRKGILSPRGPMLCHIITHTIPGANNLGGDDIYTIAVSEFGQEYIMTESPRIVRDESNTPSDTVFVVFKDELVNFTLHED